LENEHRGEKGKNNLQEDVVSRKSSEGMKGDTPLGYLGGIALRREQCDVFTPCKNCNLETRSRNYATLDEAVFSPCRAELCRVVPSRDPPRRATPRMWLSDSCKHLDDARVGMGNVTASAMTSCVSTVMQQ
jgi:hypothetical protein